MKARGIDVSTGSWPGARRQVRTGLGWFGSRGNRIEGQEKRMASSMNNDSDNNEYWSANIRIVTICLVIWALVSFGFGILLRPLLESFRYGGTDLGFWFAQQGSIIVFLVLIFAYAAIMNGIDRKHGVDEE
jgi:putative solute:sodium symporter small subunit